MAVALNPVGNTIPPYTQHAISVSLPTWADNVAYEEGEARVVDSMQSGYPRFFIHPSIGKLARICAQKFGTPSEDAVLFPSARIADDCRAFLAARAVPARVVQHCIAGAACVFAVLFPAASFSVAKQFWQHTGLGVSSRLAEHCLAALPPASPTHTRSASHKHYAAKPPRGLPLSASPPIANGVARDEVEAEALDADHAVYLEERYGRNLDAGAAAGAKAVLRRRIAGVLVRDGTQHDVGVDVSVRGVAVTEGDVFLYPTGMGAIWSSHQLALAVRGAQKSVCFGFPYTDTLKTLEKWGPGCYFLGHGLDESINELEDILAREHAADSTRPPILALFTEFPSNPLLRSADLPRLRALADKYNFLLIVDDTIGNFVNVEVLPFADIVVTSLSKVFSGETNVMGGSLVLNPTRRHYSALKCALLDTYEDTYFDADAIFMERNSRDFVSRVHAIDATAERICDLLHAAAQNPTSSLDTVFYPKYQTPAHYAARRVHPTSGFGGLFSATFKTLVAAQAFFDTLRAYKGPSLGTNFTLACPYTILAHYTELEWAAAWGVSRTLVRVSVGLEPADTLLAAFADALRAADAAPTE
ncbi:PLP-dependent transferase [Auriscalpium vulgare]|uniref:PLP-dependent transferase n=1 Tax=Auriscalpium vulgare TaxID=40419 RepID=A0ACB8RBR5_9AGAM|nr:PLP-dependent transferase [Auriscalpium vulgare]